MRRFAACFGALASVVLLSGCATDDGYYGNNGYYGDGYNSGYYGDGGYNSDSYYGGSATFGGYYNNDDYRDRNRNRYRNYYGRRGY